MGIWTLLVWVGRVRNIITDDTLSGSGRIAPLTVAIAFSIGAVAMLALRRRPLGDLVAKLLAAVSIVYWVVRGVQIGFADHSAGFIVVHSVLAGVSIGLGAWVLIAKR